MTGEALSRVADLLCREAACLDDQRWDEWLDLFVEDCVYWVPTWKHAHQPTEDPQREVSLIYYANRAGLADRIWRVRQGRSIAAAVLPRTQHAISNVLLAPAADGLWFARSNWTVHQYLIRENEVQVFFGRYEHTLTEMSGALKIAKKKILLLNDYLPGRIDFYSL